MPDYSLNSTQCIYLNNKFYIGASYAWETNTNASALCVFSSDFTECVEKLSVPVEHFALAHYHSQLVLVGGVKPGTWDLTNELLVSADGTNWQPSLPPMRVNRCGASAVNTSECLVVAGGYVPQALSSFRHEPVHDLVKSVEVLINGEWFTVQPLPSAIPRPKSYIHNGNLIVISQPISGRSTVCCCRVLLSCRVTVNTLFSVARRQEKNIT